MLICSRYMSSLMFIKYHMWSTKRRVFNRLPSYPDLQREQVSNVSNRTFHHFIFQNHRACPLSMFEYLVDSLKGKLNRQTDFRMFDRIMRNDGRSDARPAAAVKQGDWACKECGGHNFASREECFKCSAPKWVLPNQLARRICYLPVNWLSNQHLFLCIYHIDKKSNTDLSNPHVTAKHVQCNFMHAQGIFVQYTVL